MQHINQLRGKKKQLAQLVCSKIEQCSKSKTATKVIVDFCYAIAGDRIVTGPSMKDLKVNLKNLVRKSGDALSFGRIECYLYTKEQTNA